MRMYFDSIECNIHCSEEFKHENSVFLSFVVSDCVVNMQFEDISLGSWKILCYYLCTVMELTVSVFFLQR